MPHGVYDQRGELILSTDSEMLAFVTAMRRQQMGELTTILLNDTAEIMFAPATPAGQRAETAAEYQARMNSVVKEEMDKNAPRGLPTGDRPFMDKWRRGLLPGMRPK